MHTRFHQFGWGGGWEKKPRYPQKVFFSPPGGNVDLPGGTPGPVPFGDFPGPIKKIWGFSLGTRGGPGGDPPRGFGGPRGLKPQSGIFPGSPQWGALGPQNRARAPFGGINRRPGGDNTRGRGFRAPRNPPPTGGPEKGLARGRVAPTPGGPGPAPGVSGARVFGPRRGPFSP